MIASACCTDSSEISSIIRFTSCAFSTDVFKDSAVEWTVFIPTLTASVFFSTRPAVSLDASAVLDARRRTSPATTENPLPASPALAASTDAFRARILVWKAISSISLTIPVISRELFLISFMASSRLRICWSLLSRLHPTLSASLLDLTALSALPLMLSVISLMLTASSSMELACWDVPCARAWAALDTCSAPPATCSALPLICCMALRRRPPISSRASPRATKSPLNFILVR